MLTVLIRTLIIYFLLIIIMRLMGKRQIGELEVTDLVTTLLLSEIASLPITNTDLPISHAVVPMIALLILEIFSSYILIRFPKLKGLVSARPSVIIRQGVLNQSVLRELRISMDELMSEIRGAGLCGLDEVEYAILEKNGKLTVLPKAEHSPPTAKDLKLTLSNPKLMHIVYSNGRISCVGLNLIGKDEAWLRRRITKQKIDLSEVFCLTANEDGKLYCIFKEEE